MNTSKMYKVTIQKKGEKKLHEILSDPKISCMHWQRPTRTAQVQAKLKADLAWTSMATSFTHRTDDTYLVLRNPQRSSLLLISDGGSRVLVGRFLPCERRSQTLIFWGQGNVIPNTLLGSRRCAMWTSNTTSYFPRTIAHMSKNRPCLPHCSATSLTCEERLRNLNGCKEFQLPT